MGGLIAFVLYAEGLMLGGLLAQAAAARLFGMRLERLSFGVGPPLWRGGVAQLAAFPLGGFVRIAGLHPTEAPVPVDDPRAFHNRPLPARLLYFFAWPIGALAFIVACGAVVAATFGVELPRPGVVEVERVVRGSAAERGGVLPGDIIVAVDGAPPVENELEQRALEAPVTLRIERDGRDLELQVAPAYGLTAWQLGIVPRPATVLARLPPGGAVAASLSAARAMLAEIPRQLAATLRDARANPPTAPMELLSDLASGDARFVACVLPWMGAYALFYALLPLWPFAGGRLLAVAAGWRSRRWRAPERAIDAGAQRVARGRFPAVMLAFLLPYLVVAGLSWNVTAAMWVVFVGLLATGAPRLWIWGVAMPPLALVGSALWPVAIVARVAAAAFALLIPAVLLLPPVRRWYGMTCPVCGRLAARPVLSSPRRCCMACGSSFSPARAPSRR